MKLNHRLVRQLHLWVGAWGAIAAIAFGITGFLQNHRSMLKLPQGQATEVSRTELTVPESARESPDAMRAWLTTSQHMAIDGQRATGGRSSASGQHREPGLPGDEREQHGRQQSHWMFSGGNARHTLQAEFTPGSDSITVRNSVQSPLAVMSRLHKGIGAGVAWLLLSDTFALGMVALGVSGIMMWGRGRSFREIVFSVLGVAALAVSIIGGIAVT